MITLFPSGYTLSMWIKWKRASEAEKETLSDPFKVLSARQARQINFFKNWFLVRIYFKSLRSTRKVLFPREDFAFFFISFLSTLCAVCVCVMSPHSSYREAWSPIGNSIERFELMITPIDSVRMFRVSRRRSASSGSTKRTPNKSVVV